MASNENFINNSMPEEDPNGNASLASSSEKSFKPRWGPSHKGARKLAKLYSSRKRYCELLSILVFSLLLLTDVALLSTTFQCCSLSTICLAAVLGIATADFLSGLVHWAADTWGSVDIPLLGKTSFGLSASTTLIQLPSLVMISLNEWR
eukprot:TRINITY_DN22452_c0_g1_i1.p2 TRINITY_DN22452_c0_g1~~TRINITY_DN22452_c0_g1_i1.p2  ORF type:complete len:160 (-),score=23.60 TRINITY_DN22452_c0_g1_i1:26-472(-)